MFTITHNFAPPDLLLRPRPVEEPLTEQNGRIDVTIEPETRLWKLTAEAVPPKLSRGELLVLFVFLAVVVSATGGRRSGIVSSDESNAIEHMTARALQPSSER
jgi:hypothetical protein